MVLISSLSRKRNSLHLYPDLAIIVMVKKLLNFIVVLSVAVVATVIILHLSIRNGTKDHIYIDIKAVPEVYTAIVLGASVRPDGSLSGILEDRVETALELYNTGKVERFLLSGDHGQRNYDEVNAMKRYLMDRGVPISDIFLDHAGFDTYDSMYRAKHIFKVDSAIVVTQQFHLPRAVWLGRKLNLDIYGLRADRREYESTEHLKRREWLANIKAWYELNIGQKPTYSGKPIPIRGDSADSHDR